MHSCGKSTIGSQCVEKQNGSPGLAQFGPAALRGKTGLRQEYMMELNDTLSTHLAGVQQGCSAVDAADKGIQAWSPCSEKVQAVTQLRCASQARARNHPIVEPDGNLLHACKHALAKVVATAVRPRASRWSVGTGRPQLICQQVSQIAPTSLKKHQWHQPCRPSTTSNNICQKPPATPGCSRAPTLMSSCCCTSRRLAVRYSNRSPSAVNKTARLRSPS